MSLAALAFGIAPDPDLTLPATSTVDGVLEFITCLAGQFASAVAGELTRKASDKLQDTINGAGGGQGKARVRGNAKGKGGK